MNRPWFHCEGVIVPAGAFEAVAALRGAPGSDGSQCRYPIGDVKSPDFHFCDGISIDGSSYCLIHSSINRRHSTYEIST